MSLIQMACAAENQGPTSPHEFHHFNRRFAEHLEGRHALVFRLAHMGLHGQIMLAGDVAARDHEFAGAVMRDGRRDAEPQPVVRVRPSRGEPAQRNDGCVGPAHAHLTGAVAGIVGQRVDQAGHRLIECEVGNHGRDHRAQPDLGIGVRHRLHALDARRWKLEKQVVAGGRALLDMLDGMEERREVLVLMGAAAANPRRGIEKEIELPEIADALGQAAMAVGMGVDQPRNDQAAAGVDDLGIGVPHCPGGDNVGDDIAFDDDVARLAARRRDRMHQSACDHEH